MSMRTVWRRALCPMAVLFLLPACVSLQIPGKGGRPRLIGVGKTEETPVPGGSVYQVWAPGVSLRLHKYGGGVTVGNDRLCLFLPNRSPNDDRPPLGFWQRVDGLEVGPRRLMAGHYESLQVAVNADSENLVQWLQFDARRPEETRLLERRLD